jgi:predicted ferric reductase
MLPYPVRGAVWVIVYLLFVLAPLFALLAGSWPPARGFWTEFSVALGYAGLAMMGLQFGLTARFRYVTDPWGEDVIYHFHRQISLIAVGLVVAHALIQFVVSRSCSRRSVYLKRLGEPALLSCRYAH